MKFLPHLLLLLTFSTSAHAVINIVAAENSYAQVAKRIGGEYVEVRPLMSQPNQDPHLFTAGTKQAKALAAADVVIYNGAGYDTWVENLLPGAQRKDRVILVVASLVPNANTNPHIWYDPQTMPRYTKALVAILKKQDPAHAAYFEQQLRLFLIDYRSLYEYLARVKFHQKGKTLLLTEPLFEPMAEQLGLHVIGKGFAKNIMNEATPTPQEIAEFETALDQHKAQALIYNVQMISPLIDRMKVKAQKNKIPTVGISETQPLDKDYIDWILGEVKSVDEALNGTH